LWPERIVPEVYSVHLDGTSDVLDLLRPKFVEAETQLVQDLIPYNLADADVAGFRQRLEPRCDVHAVAVNVIPVDDDVADVDANTKFDPLLRRHARIALGHATLDINGATHRINDAGELEQKSVAGGLDDATPVLGNLGVDQLVTVSL
jgi:hypothetical protein